MFSVLIDGTWAEDMGAVVGNLEFSHLRSTTGGGLQTLNFSLALLPRNYSHPALHEGAKVDLFRGPVPLGSATLTELDRVTWSCTCDGLFRQAENADALDAEGYPTKDTRGAIDQAIARGALDWNGHGNIPQDTNQVYDPETDTFMNVVPPLGSIADLLNNYTTPRALRWGLDENNTPHIYDLPTKPRAAISPGIPLMPTANRGYAARTVATYATAFDANGKATKFASVSSTVGADPGSGGPETHLSLVSIPIADAQDAQEYADDYQRKHAQQATYTQGLDILPGQLTTVHGADIDLWAAPLLVLGEYVLHHGALSSKLGTTYGQTIQWQIGSTNYRAADNSLHLTSVDIEGQTLAFALQAIKDAEDARWRRILGDDFVSMTSAADYDPGGGGGGGGIF